MNIKFDIVGFYNFIQNKRAHLKSNSFNSDHLDSEFYLHIKNYNLSALDSRVLRNKFLSLLAVLEYHPELNFTEIQFKLWLYETELCDALNVDSNIVVDILRERPGTISILELIKSFLNEKIQPCDH